jgi:hypothetical protein
MSEKPTSARKLASARANAQKSTGPQTPEGKARVAQNARRHGLCSDRLVLSTEDQPEFDILYRSYVDRFQPADEIEHDLVDTMVQAKWRERRSVTLESEALEHRIDLFRTRFDDDEEEEEQQEEDSELDLTRQAFECTVKVAPYDRYEGHVSRRFDRALKQLLLLRKTAALQPAYAVLLNKANPKNEHPGVTPIDDPNLSVHSAKTPICEASRRPDQDVENPSTA